MLKALPLFICCNESGEDFHIASASACINKAIALPAAWTSANDLTQQYVKHRGNETRPVVDALDMVNTGFPFYNAFPELSWRLRARKTSCHSDNSDI